MLKNSYTSADLILRLRHRYADKQKYSFFEQVANGTGYGCSSWVDAAVLCLWPSEGLTRWAFEVKVSRHDFLNELKKPLKNAWARDEFHGFWYVAPNHVVKEEELPEGVGWLCPRGEDQLVVKRHASRKEDPPLDANLLASFGRSMGKEMVLEKKRYSETVLNESKKYQAALAWKRAAKRVISEAGKSIYEHRDDIEERVYTGLKEIVGGDHASKDRQQVLSHVKSYQSKMVEMFDVFTMVAMTSLLETDELGEYVCSIYGYDKSASTLREKRKLLKLGKMEKYQTRSWKSMLATVDAMKERAKILIADSDD